MPRYVVFYAKDLPSPMDLPSGSFDPSAYERIGTFEADSLDALYDQMQGERLEETEKGRALIQRCRETPIHTSMTVGDIASGPDGQHWLCALRGWEQIKRGPATPSEPEETAGA